MSWELNYDRLKGFEGQHNWYEFNRHCFDWFILYCIHVNTNNNDNDNNDDDDDDICDDNDNKNTRSKVYMDKLAKGIGLNQFRRNRTYF